jgi:hypothetical protein
MGTGCGKDKQTNLRFDPRFYKCSTFDIREDVLFKKNGIHKKLR